MPLGLNRARIHGGTFNFVAGDATQVQSAQAVYVAAPEDQQGEEAFLSVNAESSGVVGPQRGSRQRRNHTPYEKTQDAGTSRTNHNWPSGDLQTPSRHASFNISGSQITGQGGVTTKQLVNNISGNMTQVNVMSNGIDTLYPFVAVEALHNSGERFKEPACHPGTRTDILTELDAWSLDMSTESQLLWLHGSAGAGKSAVAQVFAGNCDEQHRLGASFFFRRGHPRRGSWRNLITSIAYQLAKSVPQLLSPIQEAIANDRLVVGRAMEIQFQKLLIEPLNNVLELQFLPIIILDGLDECEDHRIQQQILHLFIGAVGSDQFPARILICSRPEPHLREVLETPKTFGICRQTMLAADVAAYNDIRTYLCDEFSRVHSEYAGRGINLGVPWPTPETREHLVAKSSGVFIYATTVIRYVADEYSHPCDRLESVLRLDPHSTAPLDDLYTQILSVLPHTQQSLRILHAIWQGMLPESPDVDPEGIDLLLNLRSGTCRLTLRGLNSLLRVPPVRTGWANRQPVRYLHASFGDYISHPHRSGQWCISTPWLKSDYVYSMVQMLSVPPPTLTICQLYQQLVKDLPKALVEEQPTAALITLLRSGNFENSLFLTTCTIQWPQRESSYPLDLIRLWEEHSFISTLASEANSITKSGFPTFRYDWIYGMILARHDDLLSVLRILTICEADFIGVSSILTLSDLSYRVFQPFLQYREFMDFPLPKGDSPLDFLSDPRRAAELYRDPHNIAEEAMILYICHAKEVLLGTLDIELPRWFLSEILEECPTSSKLLHELQSLDLRQLCDHHAANKESHCAVHEMFLDPFYLNYIVAWLQKFTDPPLHAISFWKSQIADIEQCIETHNFLIP